MNKQEAIKKINYEMFAYPTLEPEDADAPTPDFKNGYNEASKANIKIINQLDEPQKVKVKQFVADWFERNKDNLEFAIWELCVDSCNAEAEPGIIDWIQCPENNPIETLIRMKDGYEVEEEPRWIVKVNNMYFLDWGEDGTCPTFVIDDAPGTKEQAEKYESELEAKSVAEIFGGTVEKV